MSPKQVNFNEKKAKYKAIQIAAGYEHSVVLNQNREVFWFGTTQTFVEQSVPVKMDIHRNIADVFPS